MTNKDLWKRYCDYYRHYSDVGLTLDISRMRFADNFISQMSPKARVAFLEMKKLEAGEIANPDENRMVGHYWLRTPELSPSSEIKQAITATVTKIEEFAGRIHDGTVRPERATKFSKVLVVGIGGSALGPQLTSEALWAAGQPMEVHFIDNTDPDGITRVVTQLGSSIAETLVLIISKSGGTVETRNGNLELDAAYRKAGLNFARHAVAITCEGSKLDNLALEQQWLERFPMWDWVGGRTSIFSTVGLVPMALQGITIRDFLAGANTMDRITRQADELQNPAMLLALMWHFAGGGQGKKDMVVLPYKDRLVLFSKYLQQLVMESLGKEKDLKGNTVNQGIAVYGNKGSTDQHAYVQQLRDGLNNFFATFIEVLSDFVPGVSEPTRLEVEPGITSGDYLNGFFQGTRRALFENQRDSITITIDELNVKTLGALIALYERAVGFYASVVGINAYHQPGVEAGKKAATQVVEIQKKLQRELRDNKTPRTAMELAEAIDAVDDVETVFKVLEHLGSDPSRQVMRTGERNPISARFEIR